MACEYGEEVRGTCHCARVWRYTSRWNFFFPLFSCIAHIPPQMSFPLPEDFNLATVKLENLELLDGQYNYEDWASQMAMIFHTMGVYEIVIDLTHIGRNSERLCKAQFPPSCLEPALSESCR